MQSRPSIDLSDQPVSLPGRKNSLERIRKVCWERDECKADEAQKLAKKRAERRKLFCFIFLGSVFFPVTLSIFVLIGTYKLICSLKEKYEARRELHALLCDSLPDGALEIPRGENVPTSDPYDFVTPTGGETPQSKELLGFGVEEKALSEEDDDSDCESLFGYSEETPEAPTETLLGFGLEEEALSKESELPIGGEDLVLDGALDVPLFGNQEGEVWIKEAVDKAFSEEKEISSKEISSFIENEMAPSIFFQKGKISKGGLDVLVKKIVKGDSYKNCRDDNLREIISVFEQDQSRSDTQALRALIQNKKTKLEPGAVIDGLEVSTEKSLQLKNEVNLLKRLMLYIIDECM
jgi:hypothetical protein